MIAKDTKKALAEWGKFIADQKAVEKAKAVKCNGRTLIELFVMEEKTDLFVNGVIDPSKPQKSYKIWWPIAKVLASHKFTVGSVVKIPNDVGRLEPNPEYESADKHNAMYPNDQRQLPPRFLGNNNIIQWIYNYSFVFNPLTEDEEVTDYYLVPDHLIECEMDQSLIK